MSSNSFSSKDTLEVGGKSYEIHRLDALQSKFDVARLPYSIKVLLENVLRDVYKRQPSASSRSTPLPTPTSSTSAH